MSSRQTPEQIELRRHAAWASANYALVAKIAGVATDLKAHAKIVIDAGGDPNGRRVMELRRLHRRLTDTFGDLEALPEALDPTRRAA